MRLVCELVEGWDGLILSWKTVATTPSINLRKQLTGLCQAVLTFKNRSCLFFMAFLGKQHCTIESDDSSVFAKVMLN